MYQVLLVIHVIVTAIMIGLVLIQRADSDGLSGLGAGGGMSGFMTGRSKANFITRLTGIFGAAFITTSLLLGIVVAQGKHEGTIAEKIAKESQTAPQTNTLSLDGRGKGEGDKAAGDKKDTPHPTLLPQGEKEKLEKTAPSVPKPE